MTWNQTPPAGTYGSAADAIDQRLGGTKPTQERDPFIVAGSHDLIVASIVVYNDKKLGPSVRATFEYERSTNPAAAAGSMGVKLFNLFKPAKFENQSTDADDFVDFVCKIQGVKFGEHQAAVRALIKTQVEGGQLELQPARGVRVKAFGQETGAPNPTTGRKYVKVQFNSVAQDMPTIARTRGELDQRRPLGATVTGAPVAAPPAPPFSPGVQMAYATGMSPAPAYGAPGTPFAAPPAAPPGGFGAYLQQAPAPAAPAPGKPPWNPAWGPMPAGY